MSTVKTKPPPERKDRAVADDAASVIDTSKMNEGQRAALELTEAAFNRAFSRAYGVPPATWRQRAKRD